MTYDLVKFALGSPVSWELGHLPDLGVVSNCRGFLLSSYVEDPNGLPVRYGFYPGCTGFLQPIIYELR